MVDRRLDGGPHLDEIGNPGGLGLVALDRTVLDDELTARIGGCPNVGLVVLAIQQFALQRDGVAVDREDFESLAEPRRLSAGIVVPQRII